MSDWIKTPQQLPPENATCRVAIANIEQEGFYKHDGKKWLRQDEYNNWKPVSMTIDYYYRCPDLPEPPEDE